MARVRALTGQAVTPLEHWELALSAPGACQGPGQAKRLTDWIPARAPGTTAQALEAAGRWSRDAPRPLHDHDVWWRTTLVRGGAGKLCFEGLATLAEAWLDETPLLTSSSMFAPQSVVLGEGAGGVLWICFRALKPVLAAGGPPRARWRPSMIADQGLRRIRTTLLGHMPGWCPAIDVVGPWRPVLRIEGGPVGVKTVSLRPRVGEAGPQLAARLELSGAQVPPRLACAGVELALQEEAPGRFAGVLDLPKAALWWPHTHGEPVLHPVTARLDEVEIDLGHTGFRRIAVDRGADGRGFGLTVNGEPVFCRGASWIHPDPVALSGDRAAYAPALLRLREAGMNMVRVSGVGVYESPAFFELCDALGLMIWQDFMFANFDYPGQDPAFAAAVREEAEAMLGAIEESPALSVLCGGSEAFQQATMMGLPPAELDWPLFNEVLPEAARRLRPDVPYVPNTPFGGDLPFVADAGVSHYYGVGAYERPLEDARRAGVRFAAECLAFANVPEAESLADVLDAQALQDPRWKARTPRDRGASWDFEDVRDHYLRELFGRDPQRLRREDPELYLDLSRAVSGEVMAKVFAEWRRAGSACRGGLVWTLQDLEIGAGWGLLDATGAPKPAWWMLKRVLQPAQVILTDEGVNGLAVHLLNETAQPLVAELRLAAWREAPAPLIEVRRKVELAPREARALSAFELIGRFFDLTYAYRFGPRAHAVVLAQLIAADGAVLSEVAYLPPGLEGWAPGEVEAQVSADQAGWRLQLTADRLQRFVKIADPAFRPEDDWLVLAPREPKLIRLTRRGEAPADARPAGELRVPGGHLVGVYSG